jgi:mannose/cellobiose epimerase-like protein (N-acyl-D-glucosamine 2-epimerase family)
MVENQSSSPTQLDATKKYQLGTQANRLFMASQSYNLLNFGRGVAAPWGGAGWLDNFGRIDVSHGVHTWISCRMSHVYSLGAMLGFPGSEEIVDTMLAGLNGPLHDDDHGGWFSSISLDGPEPNKICYQHAFVMLAASSAYVIGRPGAQELLEKGIATYDKFFWDEQAGMAVDTWNTEMTHKDSYRGINANMHSTEAFLAIADATGDETYRKRAGRIVNNVVDWSKNNGWRIPEHFNENWEPDFEFNADNKDDQFKPYGATPGHGIEWARLITQWALSTYGKDSEQAAPFIHASEELFNRAVKDGWDVDGNPGIVYTTDWKGNPVVHDRMHWTIAEAINTSSTLFAVTGKQEYADWYAKFTKFMDEFLFDPVNGSWFHQLDENNQVLDTVWPGKSDLYHAFQSTLIPFNDPAVSIATAVKNAQ